MESVILFVLKTAWYFLPIGVANMMPVIFSRWFNFLAFPLDGGKIWRGERIIGDHKTFRGILLAVLGGTLIFVIQKYAYINSDFFYSISLINYGKESLALGFFMGLGAITGDLVKSFFKRRMKKDPGRSWFPYDQIDYTLGGMIFGLLFFVPPWPIMIFAIVLGVLLHLATNLIGQAIGLRKAAW
ncbi:MAG: CDP-archaeol synthase [Patescibacteria group bacterium]